MKCLRCKKEIKAEALFCTQCGLNLRENRETVEKTGPSFGNYAQSYGNPYADDAYENVYGNDAYKKPYGSDPYADILKKKQEKEENPQTAERIGESEEWTELTAEEVIQVNYLSKNSETAEAPILMPIYVSAAALLDEMPSVDPLKQIEVASAYAISVITQEGTSNEPTKVFDQKIYTNWQEGVGGLGIGHGYTAEFRNCEKARYLAFMHGNWKTDRYYHGNNRPKILTLELGDFKTRITDISLFRE